VTVYLHTPIFWPPEALGIGCRRCRFNPLFAAVDVRARTVLGGSPLKYSWAVLLAVTILGSGVPLPLRQISTAHCVLGLAWPFLRSRNLSVEFPIYQGQQSVAQEDASRAPCRQFGSRHRRSHHVRHWTTITVHIEDGDRVRLIGAMGPGKRRCCAGRIYRPRGALYASAEFSALLDVSSG